MGKEVVHRWVRWVNLCRQKTQNPVVNGGSVSELWVFIFPIK